MTPGLIERLEAAGEHTPGPWKDGPPAWFKGRRDPEAGKRPINGAPGQPTIANVYGAANARLIAAAPDLLEALIEALPYVESCEYDNGYKPGAVAKVVRNMNAAILKARATQEQETLSRTKANRRGRGGMIAALYVETGGTYFNLPGVQPWDEERDARLYDGPYPVVAHPPCPRWGKMWFGQPLTVKMTGRRKNKGSDAGCFGAGLTAVRNFGGVLEHPWGSHAWPWFGLEVPSRRGGWIKADNFGGWTCCVEQGRYGHYARKPTLLYAVGVDLPELLWGHSEARLDPAVVERMGLARAKRLGEVGARGGGTDSTPRIHTPEPFRDLLISMARSAGARLEQAA